MNYHIHRLDSELQWNSDGTKLCCDSDEYSGVARALSLVYSAG